MATPIREEFEPGKQARINVTFSERVAQAINERCRDLGCAPKDYVRYCVMRELDERSLGADLPPCRVDGCTKDVYCVDLDLPLDGTDNGLTYPVCSGHATFLVGARK